MYKFLRWPRFLKRAFTLSYDDGVIYDEKLIEIMKKHGLRGTFNLNSGYLVGERSSSSRLDREQAVQLYSQDGIEVAVHGVNHYSLGEMDNGVSTREIVCDRQNLEKTFGYIVKGMAYANGSYSDDAVSVLRTCGIKYARTTVSTLKLDIPTDWLRMPATCHHKNPELMNLAKEFIEKEESSYWWARRPRLFYVWGHSYEFNNDNNWHVIEELAEYVGNRDDVWYATNGEIYDYVQAYNRLEWAVEAKMIHNPSALDVYIDYIGKEILIKAPCSVQVVREKMINQLYKLA